MSAIDYQRSEDNDVVSPASEPPKSGVHEARLLPPRPRSRALPGKEVLPAPGVPEPPRRERNQTSSFWPAPPEPLKAPSARGSKRGTPLTTTAHGFPAADLRAGAPAARRSTAVRARFAEVEPTVDSERVPPPPRSKRAHTDQGWPAPSGSIEPVSERSSFRDTKPHLERLQAPANEVIAPAPVAESTPAPIAGRIHVRGSAIVDKPRALAPEAPRPAANDLRLPSLFGDDEESIELPIQKSSARAKWIALVVVVAATLASVAALMR